MSVVLAVKRGLPQAARFTYFDRPNWFGYDAQVAYKGLIAELAPKAPHTAQGKHYRRSANVQCKVKNAKCKVQRPPRARPVPVNQVHELTRNAKKNSTVAGSPQPRVSCAESGSRRDAKQKGCDGSTAVAPY